jgi:hypothetical protein
LDYAEPNQRALLVEGIRPVLPLIRNTPYGKRIQNKLQREQMDFAGYQATLMNMAGQQLALVHVNRANHNHDPRRHMAPQALHQPNPLAEVYAAQNPIYIPGGPQTQGSFVHGHGQGHLTPQMHNIPPQAIDGYVLQGAAGHTQGLSPTHTHGPGFSGVSGYANVSTFGGLGLAGTLNDPYQRTSFGYGGM